MKTIDFSYFIERYNAGEMNEAENAWFRKELDGNDKLRQEVTLRKKAEVVLKNQDILRLRNKLSGIEIKRAIPVPARTNKKRLPLSIAATLAVIVLISGVAFFSGRHLSGDEIISRFYKSYEGVSALRSQQAVANNDYSTALDYYNIHDYKNAAFYFNKVITGDPKNMESTIFYGTSNFEIKNYPEAKQSFVKVINNNDNLYIEDAQWYLALCFIKTGEQDKAVDQLMLVKKSNSIYSKNAGKILRRIR